MADIKPKSFFERLTTQKKEEATKEPIRKVNFSSPPKNEQESTPESSDPQTQDEEGQLTVDVYQTDQDIFIRSTVAGVGPEDLDIAITNDMVTIRGKRQQQDSVKSEQYIYQECYWGPFSRSIILPSDIAADKAEAALHNGILTIRLPKAAKEQTKTIKVKSIP